MENREKESIGDGVHLKSGERKEENEKGSVGF